jgi:hypothetical protein
VHWDCPPLTGPEASAGQRWHTFTLPAAGQPWHWAFTSCAAFSSGPIAWTWCELPTLSARVCTPVWSSSTLLQHHVRSPLASFEGLFTCRQGAAARVGRRGTSVVVPHAQPQPAAPARTAAGWWPDQWRQGFRSATCRQLVSASPGWHPHAASAAIVGLLASLTQSLDASSCKPGVRVIAGGIDFAVGAERKPLRT